MIVPSRDATPRPWGASDTGMIVQLPEHLAQPAIAQCSPADAALIVAAVNNYERLLKIEAAAKDALARAYGKPLR